MTPAATPEALVEALAEFQRRNGYHRPEIEELLTEFGELVLATATAEAASLRAEVAQKDRALASLADNETPPDVPQVIRERTERQDKTAREIAAAIRAKGERTNTVQADDLEALARSIAAEKVGSADPTGARLPEEVWHQAIPEARQRMASREGELRKAANTVLWACVADMEFGLPDALHDDEPVRETLFGEWKSALRVGDLRRLHAALHGPRWPLAKDEEAAELFQSERISAALATYDFVLGDLDPGDPDREERAFDAMKAAIQRADYIARTGQTEER